MQLGATEDLESALAAAEAERTRRRGDLEAAASRLAKARVGAARRMESAVAAELEGLRLEGARFEVALRSLSEIAPSGGEAAEMMFSANPGEPLAPLARVASGGRARSRHARHQDGRCRRGPDADAGVRRGRRRDR